MTFIALWDIKTLRRCWAAGIHFIHFTAPVNFNADSDRFNNYFKVKYQIKLMLFVTYIVLHNTT